MDNWTYQTARAKSILSKWDQIQFIAIAMNVQCYYMYLSDRIRELTRFRVENEKKNVADQ